MKWQPQSRLANYAGKAVITVAAVSFFILLRPDAAATTSQWASDVYSRKYVSPRIIDSYLQSNTVRKLHIGAGSINKPGWLNTDIEPGAGQAYLDAAMRFPLPDASFQYIYSEHVIEHLSYQQARVMLKESFRVLAPGGKIRIATPNLIKFIELFAQTRGPNVAKYIERKANWHGLPPTPEPETYILNIEMRAWGHQFLYTPKMLRASLDSAGFQDVQEFAIGESDDASLAKLEGRANWDVQDVNAYETMVLQAVRR